MCLLDFVDICDHETQTEMENHRLVTAHVETAAALVLWFSFFLTATATLLFGRYLLELGFANGWKGMWRPGKDWHDGYPAPTG